MNIVEASRSYEKWLGQHLDLVANDLRQKHALMASAPFPFLRATYYRWAQTWPLACPELAKAPRVLAVADLHLENFGTWRDQEGRLVWGVNDFDEAFDLPYTNDLVRLACSIALALESETALKIKLKKACGQLLDGYLTTLRNGVSAAKPFILAEANEWLLAIAQREIAQPEAFWKKLATPTPNAKALKSPKRLDEAKAVIAPLLPNNFTETRWKQRQAGMGSLGRQRFVVIGEWQGGTIAREAKAWAPSASYWAQSYPLDEHISSTRNASEDKGHGEKSHIEQIVGSAVRCPDPYFKVADKWVVRRLAPDCTKLEIANLPLNQVEELFTAMGRETANIHWGTPKAIPRILKDAESRSSHWLYDAAQTMAKQVTKECQQWQRRR